jgi:hypothetical protein
MSEFQKKIDRLEKARAEIIFLVMMNQDSEHFKEDLKAFQKHVESSTKLYRGITFDEDPPKND